MQKKFALIISLLLCLLVGISSCQEKKAEVTPWGSVVGEEETASDSTFSVSDIQQSGELIVLTLNGPDTYYEYHGRGMGLQYLLVEHFANELGVRVRCEICSDTTQMLSRLKDGEGDIVAVPLRVSEGLAPCGPDAKGCRWLVRDDNKSLQEEVNRWYSADIYNKVCAEQKEILMNRGVVHRTYSPYMNRSKGIISRWDGYFRTYAQVAQCDWKLLAALCYQESGFDPQAKSWAGACGLMQIMPSTADHLGLSRADIFDPEKNIAASARYINELTRAFSDVSNPHERIKFALASYNGGSFHIRDAMALAKSEGKSPYRWSDVSQYVLKLQQPQYYSSPIVKHGYMRGSETATYVESIMKRYASYGGVGGGYSSASISVPHPSAGRSSKYEL